MKNLTEAGWDIYQSDLAAGQLEYDREDYRRSLYTNTKDDHPGPVQHRAAVRVRVRGDDEWARNGAMSVHFWAEVEAG